VLEHEPVPAAVPQHAVAVLVDVFATRAARSVAVDEPRKGIGLTGALWPGWVLVPENHRRDKHSGAEQLGHDEQGEREPSGRRFAVTVLGVGLGLGFGFHLDSVQ
jgi:hypothetical protein